MLTAGTALGPYRILAPLGTGGMGEVYRAHDTRLGRDVALKVISAELTHDRDRIRRFEQEACAAGALDHPNVCVVHDISSHDGSPFVVMELLEGESLRTRLNRGAIPARKAIDYIVQASQGLAAAHDKGIVHRDLKPENLFLTNDGRVKVLDFGLAKLTRPEVLEPAGEGTLSLGATQTGAILGTVGYMAPEHVRGEPADHRADLFALGSILYELLTGKRAFAGTTFYETSYRIVNEEPAPLSASGREMPEGLEAIVRRCLEKNPGERFQNARDLAFALESVREHAAGSAVSSGTAVRTQRPESKRRYGVAGVLAAVVLLAAGGWYFFGNRPQNGDAGADVAAGIEPKRVVVAVFENRTGDPSLDAVGRMAADWITDGVSRAGIEVISTKYAADVAAMNRSADSTKSPLKDPGLALAEATGSGILVTGEYYLSGSTVQIRATITETATRKLILVVEPASAPRDSLGNAVEVAMQRVRDALGVRLLGSEVARNWASLFEARPPKFEAYSEFSLAQEINHSEGPSATCVEHLKRAVELDPDFVQPYLWLTECYVFRDQHEEALKFLEQAQRRRDRLSPIGRLDVDACEAWALNRHEEAAIAYREVVRLSPGDVFAKHLLAQYLMRANHPRETVQLLTQPVRWEVILTPTSPIVGIAYFSMLTAALDLLGDHERELIEARRGRAMYPDLMAMWGYEASALAALGRFDELETIISESMGRQLRGGGAGDIMNAAAYELRAHGHAKESQAMARRAVVWYRELPDDRDPRKKSFGYAGSLEYAGAWEECAELYEFLAIKYAGTKLEFHARGWRGVIAAVQGDRESAMRASAELARLRRPYLFGYDTFLRALIAAQLGDKEQAVALLRNAISEGLSEIWLPYTATFEIAWPLESLHGYPPYEELVQPKG